MQPHPLMPQFQQAVRRSSRRPVQTVTAIEDIHYIGEDPAYTAAQNPAAGGVLSTVVLGPGAYGSANSDSDANLPTAIDDARRAYPDTTFYAGHLLNAELGGDGTDPANLVILTSTGNHAHQKFDNPIKHAVGELKKAYLACSRARIDCAGYGIRVKIRTQPGVWGPGYPDNCIPAGLACTAQIVGQPDPGMSRDVAERIQAVADAVEQANANGDVPNTLT